MSSTDSMSEVKVAVAVAVIAIAPHLIIRSIVRRHENKLWKSRIASVLPNKS